jgi:hypothetical protein
MRVYASARGGGGAGVDTVNEDNPYNYKAKEASCLFCLNHKRVHAYVKGAPSAGVEAIDDDNSYNNNVASARQLDDRGHEPEIVGGGGGG